MKLEFRDLYKDEIECRVGTVSKDKTTGKEKGFTLLLYKNARVDMALLDEVVGVGNWQREHKILGNDIYCRVGIWNEELKEWIWREDAGAEANTEVEKSKASDSFKRACVNFGLGRCLYSSPFIYISIDENNDKFSRYSVNEIEYKDHKITKLSIKNDKTNEVVYSYPKTYSKPTQAQKPQLNGITDNSGSVSMKEVSASVKSMEDYEKDYQDPFTTNNQYEEDKKVIREYYNNLPEQKKEQFSSWLFNVVQETDIDKLSGGKASRVANTLRKASGK